MSMLLIAAAAAVLATDPPPTSLGSATARATATIRIVAAVRLKLDSAENPGAPRARDALVKAPDGSRQPARLIEFQ
jgi:hypothetical protein